MLEIIPLVKPNNNIIIVYNWSLFIKTGKYCRGLALQSINKGIKNVRKIDNIADNQMLLTDCNQIIN